MKLLMKLLAIAIFSLSFISVGFAADDKEALNHIMKKDGR